MCAGWAVCGLLGLGLVEPSAERRVPAGAAAWAAWAAAMAGCGLTGMAWDGCVSGGGVLPLIGTCVALSPAPTSSCLFCVRVLEQCLLHSLCGQRLLAEAGARRLHHAVLHSTDPVILVDLGKIRLNTRLEVHTMSSVISHSKCGKLTIIQMGNSDTSE